MTNDQMTDHMRAMAFPQLCWLHIHSIVMADYALSAGGAKQAHMHMQHALQSFNLLMAKIPPPEPEASPIITANPRN